MTGVQKNIRSSSKISASAQNVDLLVHGQGVFLFSVKDNKNSAIFTIYNRGRTDGIEVEYTIGSIKAKILSSNVYLIDKNNNSGIINKAGAYYWFSLDYMNTVLYGGIGEARIEDVEYDYKVSDTLKSFLENLVSIDFNTNITPIKLLRDPITRLVPLKVKKTRNLTMDDIALSDYMPSANLTPVGQRLYNCISGKKFKLDTPDFPDFTKAIEYSVNTKGMWCYNKLQEKSTEFNPDKPNINETYLRITLGQNNGESPGIPYVMEIWPVGHYSPIHNHSGANAIIRVLHGSINVNLYPFLCGEKDSIEPFGNADFNKNDVTWITANLNQVHKLKNLETNTDTCITIQCYMYDANDTVHYDYFDYVSEDGKIEHYDPDSDMDFISFKKQMKYEWDSRNKRQRKN